VADNSDFINNRKAAQLNQYPFPEHSRFVNGCHVEVNMGNQEGIHIWDTEPVLIDGCHFNHIAQNGIVIWDAGAVITNNTFTGNERAIAAFATSPLGVFGLQIGDAGNLDISNTFEGNNYGVFAQGVNHVLAAYNLFSENTTAGILLNGPSGFDVEHNVFTQNLVGTWAVQTGIGFNFTECNTFGNQLAGIWAAGDNSGFQFRRDEHTNNWIDVGFGNQDLNGDPVPGQIFDQGGDGNPQNNLFGVSSFVNIYATEEVVNHFPIIICRRASRAFNRG
jgi:parallel beta-helix repeat protein